MMVNVNICNRRKSNKDKSSSISYVCRKKNKEQLNIKIVEENIDITIKETVLG